MFVMSFCDFLTETEVSAFAKKESVQREVKTTISQKATLSCEVSDSKTEVKWYKDGKLLSSSKTIHMEMKGKTRQLVLDSVEKKDAGEFICEAGKEKLVFKIHVAGMKQLWSNTVAMSLVLVSTSVNSEKSR